MVGGVAKVIARSDTLMVSDVLSIRGQEEPSLTEYQCITATNTCTRTGVPLFEPEGSLGDLVRVTANPNIERSDVRKYKGIDLAEYSATATRQGVQWTPRITVRGWITAPLRRALPASRSLAK